MNRAEVFLFEKTFDLVCPTLTFISPRTQLSARIMLSAMAGYGTCQSVK